MLLQKKEINNLERKYKLNLINSISGIKAANLIGTKSLDNRENLAIFSSVVHLGSSPAQLGFFIRPQMEAPRDTYLNIKETGYYTINHVSETFIKKAHYTSAKIERGVSEFDLMKIEKEFLNDFQAPFVKSSAVKIGMKHQESVNLSNGCTLVTGSVEIIVVPEEAINTLGQLDLAHYSCAAISGLSTYYGLKKLAHFPYVRTNEIPDFE